MTKELFNRIKEDVNDYLSIAEKILMGDRDNYDGADGARRVQDLCHICKELIAEVETHIK